MDNLLLISIKKSYLNSVYLVVKNLLQKHINFVQNAVLQDYLYEFLQSIKILITLIKQMITKPFN